MNWQETLAMCHRVILNVEPWNWLMSHSQLGQSRPSDSNSGKNLSQHSLKLCQQQTVAKAASCPVNRIPNKVLKFSQLKVYDALTNDKHKTWPNSNTPNKTAGQSMSESTKYLLLTTTGKWKASAADSEILGKDALRSHTSCNNFLLEQETTGFLPALVANVQ